MFDRLVDLIVQFIRLFQFFTVVRCYAGGVILRLGKFHRLAGPGFHWIWPFRIEEVLSVHVVPETITVGPQSLTTKDDVSVVISTVVTFSIADVKTFLLCIEGAGQVLEDSTYGIVAQFVMDRTWNEMRGGVEGDVDIANEISKAVRRQAKKYGVDVATVQIADFTRSRTYRLIEPMHRLSSALS